MAGIFHPDEQMILRVGVELIYKKNETLFVIFERNRIYDDLFVRSIQDAKYMRSYRYLFRQET